MFYGLINELWHIMGGKKPKPKPLVFRVFQISKWQIRDCGPGFLSVPELILALYEPASAFEKLMLWLFIQ